MTALHALWLLLAAGVGPPVSGLQVGEAVPSWEPVHVAGPDRGTRACPICTYGARPMVLVVTRDGPDAARLAAKVEELLARVAGSELKGFVMVVGSEPARLRRLARDQGIRRASLCYPQPGHEDVDLRRKLKISQAAQNTVLVYRRFRVTANFVNVRPEGFDEVERAVRRALSDV
jgi:protocatechuate 3,4-dioxygenase beta subunit